MKNNKLSIVSPKLFPKQPWNEIEALGVITWLWYQSPIYRQADIKEMMHYVLPILKNGQFALFALQNKPVGYISWAYFNETGRTHYLKSDHYLRNGMDWNCGEEIWIIDWFAPLGHSREMSRILRTLFKNNIIYHLDHKGSQRGFRIRSLKL